MPNESRYVIARMNMVEQVFFFTREHKWTAKLDDAASYHTRPVATLAKIKRGAGSISEESAWIETVESARQLIAPKYKFFQEVQA
jgi:hypothetical protein